MGGDPMMRALPAFPIMPAKVALFLNYETTREKVCVLSVPSPGS